MLFIFCTCMDCYLHFLFGSSSFCMAFLTYLQNNKKHKTRSDFAQTLSNANILVSLPKMIIVRRNLSKLYRWLRNGSWTLHIYFVQFLFSRRVGEAHCELQEAFIDYIEYKDDKLVTPMPRSEKEFFIRACLGLSFPSPNHKYHVCSWHWPRPGTV